jgi:hypothetical protein
MRYSLFNRIRTKPAGGAGVYVRAEEFVEGPGEEVNGNI